LIHRPDGNPAHRGVMKARMAGDFRERVRMAARRRSIATSSLAMVIEHFPLAHRPIDRRRAPVLPLVELFFGINQQVNANVKVVEYTDSQKSKRPVRKPA
jgi:hypothetical protein